MPIPVCPKAFKNGQGAVLHIFDRQVSSGLLVVWDAPASWRKAVHVFHMLSVYTGNSTTELFAS